MKGVNTWSYAPYKPLLFNSGDIYICRIVPSKDSIHIEWLPVGNKYDVFIKEREADKFDFIATVDKCEFDFSDLKT